MSVSVVQSGVALAASPVSAAMAAMLTLTDVAPFNLGLAQILAITLPACIVGIVVTSFVVSRMGPELDDDPEVQEKIRAGLLPPVGAAERRRRTAARRGEVDRRSGGGPDVDQRGAQRRPRLPRGVC